MSLLFGRLFGYFLLPRICYSSLQMGDITLFGRNTKFRTGLIRPSHRRGVFAHSAGKTWKLDESNHSIGCVSSFNSAFSSGGFVQVTQMFEMLQSCVNIFVCFFLSLLWQSYVLRAEIIACGIQIGIQSLTFIIFIIKLMSVLTQPPL